MSTSDSDTDLELIMYEEDDTETIEKVRTDSATHIPTKHDTSEEIERSLTVDEMSSEVHEQRTQTSDYDIHSDAQVVEPPEQQGSPFIQRLCNKLHQLPLPTRCILSAITFVIVASPMVIFIFPIANRPNDVTTTVSIRYSTPQPNDNTWLLRRLNKQHWQYGMYHEPNEPERIPLNLPVPSYQTVNTSDGEMILNLPVRLLPSHNYFDFPSSHINGSKECINAFDNFFIKTMEGNCDIPFKKWNRGEIEEPIYAWQGEHPCSTGCKAEMNMRLNNVEKACSPGVEGINYSPTRVKIDTLIDLARDVHLAIQDACTTLTGNNGAAETPTCEHISNSQERSLPDLFDETQRHWRPVGNRTKEIECTKCTEQWLQGLLSSDWVVDVAATGERTDMRFHQLAKAVERCDTETLWRELSAARSRYSSNKGVVTVEVERLRNVTEILLKGITPNDFPLPNLERALAHADSPIGLFTYERLLFSDSTCYPFLTWDEIVEIIDINPFMKILYYGANCQNSQAYESLTTTLRKDVGRAYVVHECRNFDSESRICNGEKRCGSDFSAYATDWVSPLDGWVARTLKDMFYRTMVYEHRRNMQGNTVLDGLFGKYARYTRYLDENYRESLAWYDATAAIRRYIEDALQPIQAMLDTPAELALAIYKKERLLRSRSLNFHGASSQGDNDVVVDAESAKKAYVCSPTVRSAVQFAHAKPDGDDSYWWQQYRGGYPTWEAYSNRIEKIFGYVRRYHEYCGSHEEGITGLETRDTSLLEPEALKRLLFKDLVGSPRRRGEDSFALLYVQTPGPFGGMVNKATGRRGHKTRPKPEGGNWKVFSGLISDKPANEGLEPLGSMGWGCSTDCSQGSTYVWWRPSCWDYCQSVLKGKEAE